MYSHETNSFISGRHVVVAVVVAAVVVVAVVVVDVVVVVVLSFFFFKASSIWMKYSRTLDDDDGCFVGIEVLVLILVADVKLDVMLPSVVVFDGLGVLDRVVVDEQDKTEDLPSKIAVLF